ncbi:MAG: type II secretion system F family protein [Myxococcota bacterium]
MAIDLGRNVPAKSVPRSGAAKTPGEETALTTRIAKRFSELNRKDLNIGVRERMFFTERLALLLDTDVPLHVALESLAQQATHGAIAKLTRELSESVQGGTTFARALGEHPAIFSPTYVNLVAAAELGGFLPTALDQLRDIEERQEELRSTMRSALSYPATLAVFSVAVVIFVLVVVFPKFSDIFASIHDQLPATTRWLMALSDLLLRAWIPIAVGLVVLIKVFQDWSGSESGKATLDRATFATPGLRDIAIQLNIVQILRVMGLSLENGVGMIEALQSSREGVSSQYFRDFIDRAEEGVNEGRGLTHAFNQDPLVPDLVKQMVATGEESGNLPKVMNRLSDFYEREWRRALGMISKTAEPAMLLIMGCVVGLIVSSLILPIFKLSRAVH